MTADSLELLELSQPRDRPARSHPVTSIGVSEGVAFVSVRPIEGDEESWPMRRVECLESLARAGVSIEMLQFMPVRMRFVVTQAVAASTGTIVRECGLALRIVQNCSKVTIVGSGIRTTAGIFYRTLTGLSKREIPVLHFNDSSVTISLIVPGAHATEAGTFLHEILSVPGSLGSPISFDAVVGRVYVNGRERRLGSRQAKLLEFLLANVGRVVEAEEAARHLFGADGKEEVSALRVHMHNLRKKIEDDPDNPRFIVTVPAQGYLFVR